MPLLLDLFCGAGGCAMGYHRAGFNVVGVDLNPQPNYPFRFIQGDAMAHLKRRWHRYDAIHASPPCQHFSAGALQAGTRHEHLDLLNPTLDFLEGIETPWVVENVLPAAKRYRAMRADIVLCGTMFGLGVFRHRAFQSNVPLASPPHYKHRGKVGDGKYESVHGNPGGSSKRDGIKWGNVKAWRKAMDIDWMTAKELAQAIPPAYTEFIGKILIESLRETA